YVILFKDLSAMNTVSIIQSSGSELSNPFFPSTQSRNEEVFTADAVIKAYTDGREKGIEIGRKEAFNVEVEKLKIRIRHVFEILHSIVGNIEKLDQVVEMGFIRIDGLNRFELIIVVPYKLFWEEADAFSSV